MTGNVWEWCWDLHGSYATASLTDPKGASSGDSRVLRGGSWNVDERFARASDRNWNGPDVRYYVSGFRVAARAR
jgi:formylglycine-generating enzyme required for sulfatase activity